MKPKIIQVFWNSLITKLTIVCIIITLLCFGFVILTNMLFSDFRIQKEQYLQNTQILLETNDLVSKFYNIQEYTNQFLVHKETYYLNIYQEEIDTFQYKLEYLVQFLQHENKNNYVIDIITLLQEKKMMLKQLQELFGDKKDIDILYHKILSKLEKEIDDILLQKMEANTVMLNDTLWEKPKAFGQRLRDAFRPTKKIASVNTLMQTDSTIQSSIVTTPMIDSLYELTREYQFQYKTKIDRIEVELYALLTADQYITKEITTLLLQLHENMLLNVISLGKKHENNAHRVLTWGVVAGGLALFFITLFIVFIFLNIRSIRFAHEALKLEQQKTEEEMENRHRLLLAISHDIKTPLHALLGYLELWETKTLSSKQLKELYTMQYSGKYMLALLNNLLEFTRLEQNKSQITIDNIEIVPFFMDILEIFKPLCSEKNIKLKYNTNIKEDLQILTDPLKLKQIVANLISNSVKYTSEGEINIKVEEIYNPKLQLKITISDTGKGIPKEKLSTIFEPFVRIETNSTGIEGSGLGLFVVKGLVDLLKGKIEINTEENKGTTVTIDIPCENVLENTKSVVSHSDSLQVWVIEDDSVQIQVISSMLHKLGHTTITSRSKEEFEEHIQTKLKNCNIVFTDLEIGNLTGYEVAYQINLISNIPVVCLSGHHETPKAELQQQGFYDFLEKPFTLNQLEKLLNTFINKYQEC